MPGFLASAVDAYSGMRGIGTVGAKDLSSSFTASVHAPQSVLPPLPSMTSWESSHWFPHSSLKVSRRVSFSSTAMGARGVGVDIGAGATGVVFVRLKNLLNMAFNISSGSSFMGIKCVSKGKFGNRGKYRGVWRHNKEIDCTIPSSNSHAIKREKKAYGCRGDD